MLTDDALAPEHAQVAQDMRAALARILHDLKQLPGGVRKARGTVPPPQDPVSFDRLLESRDRALRHARHAAAALAPDASDGIGRSLADVHELVEEVRAGIMSQRILDDVGEMLAEAAARSDQRALGALDARTRRIGAEADRLFALAIAAQQDLPAGAKPMPQSPVNTPDESRTVTTADAVRELSEVVAATLSGPPAGAASIGRQPVGSPERRYGAVADQISASLQAYGMPHEGAQLPGLAASETVRAQLIEGLQRNFGSREQDGTRIYYRSAPQPVVHDAQGDGRLLRGSALVHANLLRAEADGVLAIVDRLPDMLRFVPAQPRGLSQARARLRGLLDQIVETASDPLGMNAPRGKFQFKRLSAALLDVLRSGEVIGSASVESWPDTTDGVAGMWEDLADGRGWIADDLRSRASTVRNEEVVAELTGLGQLMADIHGRIGTPVRATSRGVAAGRLEEIMTAADTAAAMLEEELERFGTSPAEQEIQFLGVVSSDVSVAQFIGWIRALCAPFAGGEHYAAGLFREDLQILRDELRQLEGYARDFAGKAASVRFGGVRRQFAELQQFVADAAIQAGALVGEPGKP